MGSSIEYPIHFFEHYLRDINQYKEEFVNSFIIEGYSVSDIDKERGIVTCLDVSSEGETVTVAYRFEHSIKRKLYAELQNSKLLIDNYVLQENENYLKYLYLQENTLQYLLNNEKQTISLFPVFLDIICELRNYINNKYLLKEERKIQLNLTEFNTQSLTTDDDEVLLQQILGYLKAENDKRQKIMSDKDYDRMILYINHYIESNSLPENIEQIPALNISKNLLRFTFWILHKHLYTTSSIKDDFVLLVHKMFSDFNDWEFKTLKNKFGNKDKVTVSGKKFIPEIIKIELANRQ